MADEDDTLPSGPPIHESSTLQPAVPHDPSRGISGCTAPQPNPDVLSWLPDEVIERILMFVDQNDLPHVALACSRLAHLCALHIRPTLRIPHAARHLTDDTCRRLAWHRPERLYLGTSNCGELSAPAMTHLGHLQLRSLVVLDECGDAHAEALAKARLAKLQTLELIDASKLTDAGAVHLSALSALTCLGLHWADRLTSPGLGFLTALHRLRTLKLSWCPAINDDAFQHCTALTALKRVWVLRGMWGVDRHRAATLLPGVSLCGQGGLRGASSSGGSSMGGVFGDEDGLDGHYAEEEHEHEHEGDGHNGAEGEAEAQEPPVMTWSMVGHHCPLASGTDRMGIFM